MKLLMNDVILSVFLGPLFLILFFLCCLAVVAGVKIILLYFRRETPAIAPQTPAVKRARKKPVRSRAEKPDAPAKPAAIRSIEIDPSQVDKIYVKKIS